jgi:hypothetical protein
MQHSCGRVSISPTLHVLAEVIRRQAGFVKKNQTIPRQFRAP